MDLILWYTILIALFAMSVNASILPDPKLLSRAVNRRKKTLSTVLILLLVFAVVFILIGLGTIIYLCKRREERKKKIKPEEISAHEEPFLPPRGAGPVGAQGGAGGGGGGSTGSRPVSRIAYDGDWWNPPSQEGSRRSSNRYSGVPPQVPPQSSINRHSGADYNNNNNLNVPTVGSVNSHHQQRHSAYSLTPSRLSRVPPVEEPTDRPFQIPLPPPSAPSAPPSSNTHSTITKNTNNNAPVPAPAPARIPSPIITNPFVSAPTSVDSHSQNHASLHHVLTQPFAIQSIPPPPPTGSSGPPGPIPNTNPFNNNNNNNNNNRHVNFSPPSVPPSSYHQNVQLPYLVPQQTGTSIYSTINPYEPTAMTKSTAGH